MTSVFSTFLSVAAQYLAVGLMLVVAAWFTARKSSSSDAVTILRQTVDALESRQKTLETENQYLNTKLVEKDALLTSSAAQIAALKMQVNELQVTIATKFIKGTP